MKNRLRRNRVSIVTGYDRRSRPIYPGIAVDCLEAGCHVWMEKPPAASCREIKMIMNVAEKKGKAETTLWEGEAIPTL
jgi:hypothetical protein